ncbi:MAG: SGNH/GDSL hydrolase family protein, partial [Armatimonadia bacterium]
ERRLNALYGPQVQFCASNAGVGGENTAEGLARIQRDVLDHSPDLVLIEFGLNDIRYEPAKRLSEEQFAENLREMHRLIAERGAAVIFMTPTPIVGAYHVYSQGTDYYNQWGDCNGLNAIYAEIIRQTARKLEAPLCDIYAAFVQEAVKAEFRGETFDYRDLSVLSRYISSRDGVHPTAAGQELIAAELYAVIVTRDLLVTRV